MSSVVKTGVERWLCSPKHWLFLYRTQILVPNLTWHSQPSVTQCQGISRLLLASVSPIQMHIRAGKNKSKNTPLRHIKLSKPLRCQDFRPTWLTVSPCFGHMSTIKGLPLPIADKSGGLPLSGSNMVNTQQEVIVPPGVAPHVSGCPVTIPKEQQQGRVRKSAGCRGTSARGVQGRGEFRLPTG